MLHHDKRFLVMTAAASALMSAIAAPPASAQVEEIVVTARKREENLMEVPLSISAVSATNIESANLKDVRDLAQFTPGLWIEYGVASQSSRQLTFRGLSVSTGQVFVDGAPYAGAGNPNLGALERVEVLVGPQSAYFGRSTFEGALNYVTKEPSSTFKGEIKGDLASYNTNDTSLSLEGPLVKDKLGIRVIARHYSAGGQWTNEANPSDKLGAVSKNSVTGTMVYNASDNLKAKLLLDYAVDDDGYTPTIILSAFGYNGVPQLQSRELFCNTGGTFGSYWCGALPTAKGLSSLPHTPGTPAIISANNVLTPFLYDVLINNSLKLEPLLFDPHWLQHVGFKQETESAHLNLDYTTPGNWSLSSVTAIHRTKYQTVGGPNYRDEVVPNTAYPRTPNTLPIIGYHQLTEGLTYDASQELRITTPQEQRLRGTAGANYLSIRSPGSDNYGIQPNGPAVAGAMTRSVTKTPAVFGGVYFDLLAQLTLGAEARYQWDQVQSTGKFPTVTAPLVSTFKSFSPRVTLDYKPVQGQLVYALWSRGYRPGGFNAALVGSTPSVVAQLSVLNAGISYAQEELDNFEGGLKSTWLGGKLQTRIDGYYDKWKNGQVTNTISIVTAAGQGPVTVTQNLGLVDLKGVEFEGAAAITDKLTVTANFDYQTSEIKAYVYLPFGPRVYGSSNVNGHVFPNAPDLTFTVTPTYTDHLVGDWDWFTRLDWKHRGKYFIDPTNLAWLKSSDIIDLRLGVKNQSLTLEGYVQNLTNNLNFASGVNATETTGTVGTSVTNAIRLILPQKRMFGIKASYNF